jgi:cytochrome b561
VLLYVLLVAVPLMGLASVSFTPYPLKFFGIPLPKPFEPDKLLNELFSGTHKALAWTLATLIAIHVADCRSHMLRRDGVLQRMLPAG